MELLADVPFNIVCFRYSDARLDEPSLNDLNQEILMRLHERGLAVPSYTRIHGQFALRVSITNHRTTSPDLDFLVEQVLALAHEIEAEQKQKI